MRSVNWRSFRSILHQLHWHCNYNGRRWTHVWILTPTTVDYPWSKMESPLVQLLSLIIMAVLRSISKYCPIWWTVVTPIGCCEVAEFQQLYSIKSQLYIVICRGGHPPRNAFFFPHSTPSSSWHHIGNFNSRDVAHKLNTLYYQNIKMCDTRS